MYDHTLQKVFCSSLFILSTLLLNANAWLLVVTAPARGVAPFVSSKSYYSVSSSSSSLCTTTNLGTTHGICASNSRRTSSRCSKVQVPTRLLMAKGDGGLLGSIMEGFSSFLDNRKGDFVKLAETREAFGPGPLLILYNAPNGIDDEEIQDMIADGAPVASQKGCILHRITTTSSSTMQQSAQEIQNDDLELSLKDALERIASGRRKAPSKEAAVPSILLQAPTITPINPQFQQLEEDEDDTSCLLFFSGFRNDEMMTVYNILGKEIYDETRGRSTPACAKAVPNAMQKPLGQVLREIAGDHADAMKLDDNLQQ